MNGALRIAPILLAAVLAASVPAPGRASSPPELTGQKNYAPGLGEFMTGGVQPHHIKLWFAAVVRDWKLAAYEADELSETFADIVTYQPDWNGIPIAQLVQTTAMPTLKAVSAAIAAKDMAQFRRAYADLVAACNRCHVAAQHGFVKITIPTSNPFSDQRP
jgi:hypothetical protein